MDAEAKKQARGEINENDRTDVMAAGGRYPRPALELDNSYLYRNTACSSHRGVLKCFSLYIKGTKKLDLCLIVLISLFQVKCTFFMVFADIRSNL